MPTNSASTRTVGVIMNGVTGRMGSRQHLKRSIMAIRAQGGIDAGDGQIIVPEPVLVGRNPAKLDALAQETGVAHWTTDLDEALGDPSAEIYFDAQTTDLRFAAVKKAIEAGKHVYCEKPTALTTDRAVTLYEIAVDRGAKNGVVQDKLWLPGIAKLRGLVESGYFGSILSVRCEFGYWVFEGEHRASQRPSWNYRNEDGGGIILDMFPHWRYVLDQLFGSVRSVFCVGATHIPKRWDERGRPFDATAEDAAYAILQLEDGVVAQFNSSWAVRVRRDDLVSIQVDGTGGSAVAGLRSCRIQPAAATPRPVWDPDSETAYDYFADWMEIQGDPPYDNAFKVQWELFLKHVVLDDPFPWTLLEGAKGVQLAEKAYESWQKGAVIEIGSLTETPAERHA